MTSLREAQKQLTRRRLLTAALETFQAKGYAATTVDDIAKAAGTTRVTFYAYFPNRSDLMSALVDEQLNESLQRDRSDDHGSTATDLVAVVAAGTRDSIEAWMRERVTIWPEIRPIIRIARQAAGVDPDLGDIVERWMEEAVADIEEGLERAGRFEKHQRHFRGVLAIAELDYVAQNWGSSDWKLEEEQMITELVDSWVRLLAPAAD
ncbi:TetR/AcrR family transcriptional regulator [Gordonia sp. VNQ95]|jgi:AcrR family transcriptional regulator|uniref:TetR/AcrR family transcriptional regulator n=1 Tax=Gordonia TaxID=2053 RepID=UPI0032B529B3